LEEKANAVFKLQDFEIQDSFQKKEFCAKNIVLQKLKKKMFFALFENLGLGIFTLNTNKSGVHYCGPRREENSCSLQNVDRLMVPIG